MAIHGETVFLQRVCLGSECQAVFWICRHCDRGQRYCSRACSAAARLKQRRRANSRYQRSKEGRLDHRDRQNRYRRRQPQARVTDQSSQSIVSPARYQCGTQQSPRMAVQASLAATVVAPWPRMQPYHSVRCAFCGRSGHWIDPFPRIPPSG